MATVVQQLDRALSALRIAQRRGRPSEQDRQMADAGFVPVAVIAAILGKRVGTIYKARDTGRLKMTLVRGYWYVHQSDALHYAATPVRFGRPPKGGSDAR